MQPTQSTRGRDVAHDLVIRSAVIVTSTGRIEGDLAVSGGRIAAIGEGIGRGAEEMDARGLLLLPGGIDTHCHIAQLPVNGEPPCPDDFESGTRAAAAGGTTTVIPFSMCARGDNQETALRAYLTQAEGRAVVDYSVHLQMPEADPRFLADVLPRLAAEGFTSLKLFTTYEGYTLSDPEILTILEAAGGLRMLCLLHAEDDALVRHLTAREIAAGRTGLERHGVARPIEAEAEMIHRVANYAAVRGARVHVFHVSGLSALDEIERAAARGVLISGETCAHYLSFTAEDVARPDFEGARFLCAPALRGASDRAALWQALADGRLALVSSDHSPSHRLNQIARARNGAPMPFTAFSGGIPGLETLLPVVFSEGVARGRLTLERFVEITAAEPARLFGLAPRKGTIAEGADADLVLWDPNARWTVAQRDMQSRVDFTPWEGIELTGRPVTTISRGRIVMRQGRIDTAAAGHGRLVHRERTSA